jgi:NADPH-dependent glutamate synthase beta subunit-like oxidoreductase/2,4-dienoyl-CoA reductase-like NADH-dependent reductase (Old Yellow Enzyme family)
MELPDYEPFYIQSLGALREEIARLGLEVPIEENLIALADSLRVGQATITNRFCAQPISGADASDDGSPTESTLRRYRSYAEGAFGLIWVERTAAMKPGTARQLCLSPATLPEFAALVAQVKAANVAPPVVVLQLAPDRTEALVNAARLAREAGFDGVDVQGEPESLPETLSRIRAAIPDLLLATRLCAYEAVRDGFGVSSEDFRNLDPSRPFELVERLEKAGLQLLNITCSSPVLRGPERGVRSKADHEPPDEHPLMALSRQLRLARSFRERFPGVPIIGSGLSWLRQFGPPVAAGALVSGGMDIAGLGRSALAYPGLPAQVLHGQALDPGKICMVCGACSQLERGGRPVGCVVRDPDRYGPVYRDLWRLDEDRLRAGASRCHLCEAAPCSAKSATRTDIPAFIKAFREGREGDAYSVIRKSNPLPRLVSKTSPFWLEDEGACIETTLTGEPVPIRDLQYAIAWRAGECGETGVSIPRSCSGKSVAVVGGGPTGIAATARLLELGHRVQLHETSDVLGGIASRLLTASRALANPMEEINALLRPALESDRLKILFGSTLGTDVSLVELQARHDAVLLAVGLWKERSLGLAEGVLGALDFLEHWRGPVPSRVAVLAGGDSAMDACVALKARGASELYVVFGGPRHTLHWHMSEGWFANSGVHALMGWQPLAYASNDAGRVHGVRLRHAEFGLETVLCVDLVVEAMGLELAENLPAMANTSHARLYKAGAMVNGGASVGRCVGDGLSIAEIIHRELRQ